MTDRTKTILALAAAFGVVTWAIGIWVYMISAFVGVSINCVLP